jgi:hypothetical protein
MSSESEDMSAEPMPSGMKPGKPNAVHLPSQVVSNIVSFLLLEENLQGTLYVLCLVSRIWYSACIESLYQCPALDERRSQLFIRTICPPRNLGETKRPLSQYVKTLDMSAWHYDISEHAMGKVLRRVAGGLEVFAAPNIHFS